MTTSIDNTEPANKTSAKRMAIMLILAFLGGHLNAVGAWATLTTTISLPPRVDSGMALFSQNIPLGIFFSVLAFLLLSTSFLALSLCQGRGRRQIIAGVLGTVTFIVGVVISEAMAHSGLFNDLTPAWEISLAIAIAVCLLTSGGIKGWSGLVGLVLGLIIGTGLRTTNLFSQSSLAFSSIWLSAVFFPEVFSRRAGWRTVLFGGLLWVALVGLSSLIDRSLSI
ncbi:MAG: hypothetical protein WA821_20920 [Anaerolineales bacterium]